MSDLISLLSAELPRVFRWVGALARQLRRYDIALAGKHSGYASTDALTLAALSVQEILVGALRDVAPTVRQWRTEPEESAGDLGLFAKQGDWVLGIDPIDGTRGYRDRVGTEYAVMLHARTRETVHYSLVYLPEESAEGTWLEVRDGRITLGPDNASQQARAALARLPPVAAHRPRERRRMLVSGFLGPEGEGARARGAAGGD